MDDAVAHDDAQAKRAPVLLLKSVDDSVANVVVVGGRVGNLPGETRYCLQQIGARHDADDFIVADHRQSLDFVPLHQLNDLFERGVFGDGEQLRRHDFGDLAAVFVNEIACLLTGAENESQKSTASALGSDFAAANEVALGDNADQFAGRIDYGEPADVLLKHGICGFDDCGLRGNGDDGSGHDLMGAHSEP